MAKQSALDFKTMTIHDIAIWCKEHNQLDWLKETAAKEVPYAIYPRKRVPKLDKDGNQVYTKKGKPAFTWEADKDAKPTIEMRPISYVQIKSAFCEKFAAELNFQKKEKRSTMHEIIASL